MDHNYFPWFCDWKIKIGEYGNDFEEQFAAGETAPFDPDEKKNQYESKTKKCLDSQAFTYSEQQMNQLDQMQAGGESQRRIDNFMAHCFQTWYTNRAKQNADIEREIIYNAERIKSCIKDSKEYRDKATKLFSNILTSMSETSQQLVKNYKVVPHIDAEAEEKDENQSYAISDAEKALDWMGLFHAAEETHVRNLADHDEATTAERQQNELRAKSGSFTRWVERFEDCIRVIESLGFELGDVQKRCAFMRNLNKEIFKSAIADWNNLRSRNNSKKDFVRLKEEMMQEYLAVMAREPELVMRVDRPPTQS